MTTTNEQRTLSAIHVSWGRRVWHNGERGSEGFGFTVTKDGIERSVTGSLTQGTMKYTNLPACEAVSLLTQIREKIIQKSGRASVALNWDRPDTISHRETVWRVGQYSSSMREREEEQNNPPTNDRRSPTVDMIVSYLETGDEGAIKQLSDYLKDRFNLSD